MLGEHALDWSFFKEDLDIMDKSKKLHICFDDKTDISTEIPNHEHTEGDFTNFEDLMKELDKPIPWYEYLYNVVAYQIPFRIKCKIDDTFAFFERGQKGYATSDVWNFYGYLAEVISKGTLELKGTTHGYPPEITQEEWSEVLEKISKGFAHFADEDSCEGSSEEEQKEIDEAFDLLKKWFVYLWD